MWDLLETPVRVLAAYVSLKNVEKVYSYMFVLRRAIAKKYLFYLDVLT